MNIFLSLPLIHSAALSHLVLSSSHSLLAGRESGGWPVRGHASAASAGKHGRRERGLTSECGRRASVASARESSQSSRARQ
jgi:hypothetical protein